MSCFLYNTKYDGKCKGKCNEIDVLQGCNEVIAVFVNCAAVLVGSLIGFLFSHKITDSFSVLVTTAAGIVSLVLGFQMAFEYQNIIYMTLALMVGGFLGTLWDIDGKILLFGSFLERTFKRSSHTKKSTAPVTQAVGQSSVQAEKTSPSFAYAFLNASVLFCVGAMSILGSFKAGIEGDYTIIYTKSVLDGFMAIVFTAAMGIGTAFSVIMIFIYQGTLTLASTYIAPWVNDVMLTELSALGGCLIIMIGINLLGLKKIKTANFLPAIVLIVLFQLADPFVQKLVAGVL